MRRGGALSNSTNVGMCAVIVIITNRYIIVINDDKKLKLHTRQPLLFLLKYMLKQRDWEFEKSQVLE